MVETTIETQESRYLKAYLKYRIRPLLRVQHLNRDIITIFVGDRGSGKSEGCGEVAWRDYMLAGEPCWSNMSIKVTIEVPNEEVADLGIKGGKVTYQSMPLDIDTLLLCDGTYSGGVLVIDEVNMEVSEARRSSSNVNLYFDRVGQQLRKDQTAMICTVIDEMWVDTRLRELADNIIQCRDRALTVDGLRDKKPQGIDYQWLVYPMSRKLCGVNCNDLADMKGRDRRLGRIALPPWNFSISKKFWPLVDSFQKQAEGKYTYSRQIGKSKKNQAEEKKWGWLYETLPLIVRQCIDEGRDDISWGTLRDRLAYLTDEVDSVSDKELVRKLVSRDIGFERRQTARTSYYKFGEAWTTWPGKAKELARA